jgi:hypothetical protein
MHVIPSRADGKGLHNPNSRFLLNACDQSASARFFTSTLNPKWEDLGKKLFGNGR